MVTSINIILKAFCTYWKIRPSYDQIYILESPLLWFMGEKLERGKAVVRETRKILLVLWFMWDRLPAPGWHYLALCKEEDIAWLLVSYNDIPFPIHWDIYEPNFYINSNIWHFKLSYEMVNTGVLFYFFFFKLRAISNTVYLKISKSNILVISKTMLSLQVYLMSLSLTQSSVASSNKNIDISLLIQYLCSCPHLVFPHAKPQELVEFEVSWNLLWQ